MYSHYMEGAFSPLEQTPRYQEPPRHKVNSPSPAHGAHRDTSAGGALEGLTRLLGGTLKNFSLRDFDTGDILLVLIVLFLFLEGDNLELVITLGLMLFLGLNDQSAT